MYFCIALATFFYPYQKVDSLKQEEATYSVQSDSTLLDLDTINYGIKNTDAIPVRTYSSTPKSEQITIIRKDFSPTIKKYEYESWLTIILILGGLLVALAKAFSVNRFKLTYKSLFNYRVAQEICTEEKVFFHRVNIILTINYLLMITMVLFLVKEQLTYIDNDGQSYWIYMQIIIFLAVIYGVKFIFTYIIAGILDAKTLVTDYIFNVTLYNNLLGVLLIAVLSITLYTSIDFYIALKYLIIPVLAFSFMFRLLRLFVIGKLKDISYLYIFLYICTLEILPFVVMIKFFILQ